eukprot:Rhum_TRINITY_DN15327_c4_g2::Rhum_TRINITY_DN15327_c4_g2_i6::g.151117::m.151117
MCYFPDSKRRLVATAPRHTGSCVKTKKTRQWDDEGCVHARLRSHGSSGLLQSAAGTARSSGHASYLQRMLPPLFLQSSAPSFARIICGFLHPVHLSPTSESFGQPVVPEVGDVDVRERR